MGDPDFLPKFEAAGMGLPVWQRIWWSSFAMKKSAEVDSSGMKRLILAVMVVVGCCGRSYAAAEFDLGIGYAHLNLSGSDRFEDRDGVRFEPRISFAPIGKTPELRLGFGLGLSGYSHELDDNTIIVIDDGDVETFHADQWESVSLLVPELQISWRQMLGDRWFVEPGVGVGVVFANYYVADEFWFSGDDNTSEWDATFGVRPFLRAGYQGEHWVFGLEGSYLFGGNVSLIDEVDGDVGELYAGGFFGYRW
jgi:hypothetical protein